MASPSAVLRIVVRASTQPRASAKNASVPCPALSGDNAAVAKLSTNRTASRPVARTTAVSSGAQAAAPRRGLAGSSEREGTGGDLRGLSGYQEPSDRNHRNKRPRLAGQKILAPARTIPLSAAYLLLPRQKSRTRKTGRKARYSRAGWPWHIGFNVRAVRQGTSRGSGPSRDSISFLPVRVFPRDRSRSRCAPNSRVDVARVVVEQFRGGIHHGDRAV